MNEVNPAIEIINEKFEIPQLETTRRVSILLPHDYHHSKTRYPVLYLQDGQNLFNPHAPFGNWDIDNSMGKLAKKDRHGLIVVAVDHGEESRLTEYLPFRDHPRFGDGLGAAYIEFLTKELIPFINKNYRTNQAPEATGIGGSSMGGLISLYAGLTQPKVFGKMMIFSPSLWISSEIYDLARAFKPKGNSIYLYAGGRESWTHLRNVRKMTQVLRNKKPLTMEFSVNLWARHSEQYWRKEFPRAVNWLYFKGKQYEIFEN